MERIHQGDFGELCAMHWFAAAGATIAVPVGRSRHWDFVADLDGDLRRVQVKTSSFQRNGRWETMLCTKGGNRSWSGVAKLLDATRFDDLYIHVGDGRRWLLPAAIVGGRSAVLLGGPKYSAYELEPGAPLPVRHVEMTA
jgi:hypothetical protein